MTEAKAKQTDTQAQAISQISLKISSFFILCRLGSSKVETILLGHQLTIKEKSLEITVRSALLIG
jgi:hypothetical protein